MTTTGKPKSNISYFVVITTCLLLAIGCSKAYYGAMEKVGVHKRDILVDRVENARDAQADAQEQFKDALEQFGSVVNIETTDLKEAYEKLNSEYEDSDEAAKEVSSRIKKVESVADDLFAEWEKELDSIHKPRPCAPTVPGSSKTPGPVTIKCWPVCTRLKKAWSLILRTFHDNVLYLKHNLNAQAIGSLRSEFAGLKVKIEDLIQNMNDAITNSNQFIKNLNQ